MLAAVAVAVAKPTGQHHQLIQVAAHKIGKLEKTSYLMTTKMPSFNDGRVVARVVLSAEDLEAIPNPRVLLQKFQVRKGWALVATDTRRIAPRARIGPMHQTNHSASNRLFLRKGLTQENPSILRTMEVVPD
jgi:hypothetical protein